MRDPMAGAGEAALGAEPLQGGDKVCGKCRASKPRDAFTAHGRSKDGLAANCDECRGIKPKVERPAATGEKTFNLPTVHGVFCSVHRDRGVMLSEPGANEDRVVRLNVERAIAVARFILAELSPTEAA